MSDSPNNEDNVSIGEPITQWLTVALNASIRTIQKIRQFSYSNAGIGQTLLTLLFLLFSALLTRTTTIIGPYTNLTYELSILFSFISVISGHLFASRLTKDGRWRLIVFYFPIILSFILLLISVGGLQLSANSMLIGPAIGYLTVVEISLLAGILSGEIKSAPWLGAALFTRHIQPKLVDENIQFLHWDTDGTIRLYEANKITPRWDEKTGKPIVQIDFSDYPFNHFVPVIVDNAQPQPKISSAHARIVKMYADLPAQWNHVLQSYKLANKESNLRTSWLVILQLVIPQHSKSLLAQNSRLPGRSQRIKIDDISASISWPPPPQNWTSTIDTLLDGRFDKPALHNALMATEDPQKPLSLEEKIATHNLSGGADFGLAGVDLLRSYTHLMIKLYENISAESSSRSDLCKRVIRSVSTWFAGFRSGRFLLEISTQTHFSYSVISSHAISLEYWVNLFEDALIEPTTQFLTLHDKLLNIVDNADHSKQINGAMMSMVSECTSDVISSGNKKPRSAVQQSTSLRLGRVRDLGRDRKAALLIGICKMELMLSLIDEKPEDSV